MRATVSRIDAGRRAAWRACWQRYVDSVKYAGHVLFHPFDGFWDLVHEGRGTLEAGHTFILLFLFTRIVKLVFTNFQFIESPLQNVNIFEQCASLFLPFIILCVANWGMTTLFDGKGRFRDIYMAMAYALVPYIIIQLPLTMVSNVLSFGEAEFYQVIMMISLVWAVFLAFIGLMQVHDYSPSKTIMFLIVTVLGALIIVFIILVFFSLLNDSLAWFISLYREIIFRLN